jgi:hypothetical protein
VHGGRLYKTTREAFDTELKTERRANTISDENTQLLGPLATPAFKTVTTMFNIPLRSCHRAVPRFLQALEVLPADEDVICAWQTRAKEESRWEEKVPRNEGRFGGGAGGCRRVGVWSQCSRRLGGMEGSCRNI